MITRIIPYVLLVSFSSVALADGGIPNISCKALEPKQEIGEETHDKIVGKVDAMYNKFLQGDVSVDLNSVKKYALGSIPNADKVMMAQMFSYIACLSLNDGDIEKKILFFQKVITPFMMQEARFNTATARNVDQDVIAEEEKFRLDELTILKNQDFGIIISQTDNNNSRAQSKTNIKTG
jgi:hypothetical protein